MKWFFAYNGYNSDRYGVHIEMMIRSALANTSLEPHLLYFGDRDNPIVTFAEERGVEVLHREPSILADLQRIEAKFPDYRLDIASGTFLRIDVPLICRELGYSDQFVLYTDCDVVFLRDIPDVSTQPFLRPTFFSCAPEEFETDWVAISAGVMVMNVESLLNDYPSFKRFITSGDTLYYELFKNGPWDQRAYRLHYASKWDKLPAEYNWKPYWGYNEDALVVHFHGIKVPDVPKIIRAIANGRPDRISTDAMALYQRDPDSYRDYLAFVEKYTSDRGSQGR